MAQMEQQIKCMDPILEPASLPKPQSPCFGSGPTKKHPGWALGNLSSDLLGRSHRSPAGVEQLQKIIDLTREILAVPQGYQIAIVPGSATGAIECALWSFLGSRPVDVFAWDVFGKLWVTDVVEQLRLPGARIFTADFGKLPDLTQYHPENDVIFTYNGTSAGVCVPNLDWIPDHHSGLTICDATSSAFALEMDWAKLDVTCFSWQKGLGGEAAHGVMVLSPRAIQHLQNYTPAWPIPRLFRLTRYHQIIDGIFIGKTINTPSMLCVADCLSALKWAQNQGGIHKLQEKTMDNFLVVRSWLKQHAYFIPLAEQPQIMSPVSVCFKLKPGSVSSNLEAKIISETAQFLATHQIAYDVKNHYLAPPSFRLWCGPTMERDDLVKVLSWIDWAFDKIKG
jgi:phosphoserine aminotransferase